MAHFNTSTQSTVPAKRLYGIKFDTLKPFTEIPNPVLLKLEQPKCSRVESDVNNMVAQSVHHPFSATPTPRVFARHSINYTLHDELCHKCFLLQCCCDKNN